MSKLVTGEYLIYLRKSRQDNQFESVESVLAKHEVILQDYAHRTFGYMIPQKNIYREVVSGETIEERCEMQKLLERIKKGNTAGVLCVDCSRLSRGDLLDCGLIVHAFRFSYTLIVTPTMTYDLENKHDRKLFEMELTRGNDYLEYTKEILQRGIYESVRRGNFVSSIAPFGYDRIKVDGAWTLKINEKEADYVRLAFKMYIDGTGANTIAQTLNELGATPKKAKRFNESVIRQMLTNEVYIGKIRWNKRKQVKEYVDGKLVKKRQRVNDYELFDGKHEAIISEETFSKAMEQKGRVTREKPNLDLQNPYAGLMKCVRCGRAIALRVHRKNGVEFRKPRLYCRGGVYCDNKSHNFDEVHNSIVKALKARLENFEVEVNTNCRDTNKERESLVKTLENELKEIDKKKDQICDYLESGVYTVEMFVSRKDKLESDRERVESALTKAREEMPTLEDMQVKLATFHEALDMLMDDTISAKTKNVFLKKIIDVILYDKGDEVKLDIRMK